MLSLCLLYLSVDIVFFPFVSFDNSNCYYIYTIRLLLAKVKKKITTLSTQISVCPKIKNFPKTRSAQEPLGAWAIIMKKS